MTAGQYHINLETGEPGPCSARKGNCPFGGDELHFTSEDGARQAYELIAAVEKAKTLQAWKKKPKVTPPTAPTPSSGGSGHGRRGAHGAPIAPSYGSSSHGGPGLYGGHGR